MIKKSTNTKGCNFPEANGLLRGSHLDAYDLPVYRDGQNTISCWKIPFLRRLKILFTGRIWLCIQGDTHAPLFIETEVFEKHQSFKNINRLSK